MSRHGGLRTNFEQPAGGSASFFVTDLLRKIIFPDRQLGTTSKLRVARHVRKQVLIGAGLLVLTTLIVIPAATSYLDNVDLIDATALDVQATRLPPGEPLGGDAALGLARSPARAPRPARPGDGAEQHPLLVGSLHRATRARRPAGPLSRAAAGDRGGAAARATERVGALGGRPAEPRPRELHLRLRRAPPLPDDDGPDRLEPEWATSELARVWAQASQRGALGGRHAVRRTSITTSTQLAADKSWAWSEDGILVERARGRLASMPVDVIAYSALEAAAKGAPPIRPDQIFVGNAARFLTTKGRVEVPGLYTRLGWEKVRPLLKEDKEMHFAPWVLGQGSSSGEASWSIDQLRSQYFERYERAWYDFFLGLNIATPATLRAAIEELAAIGKVDGPYVRLFRRFADNVRLEFEKPTLLEKIVDKVEDKAEKKVEKADQREDPGRAGAAEDHAGRAQLRAPPGLCLRRYAALEGHAAERAAARAARAVSRPAAHARGVAQADRRGLGRARLAVQGRARAHGVFRRTPAHEPFTSRSV